LSQERSHGRSLAVIRSTQLARDAVLSSMIGVAAAAYGYDPRYPGMFFLLFLSDIVALILLCIPREVAIQIGVGWAGVMTIVLFLPVGQYLGGRYLASGAFTVIVLSIVELLTIIKFGYDSLREQAQSWKNDSE
jgi:hypothetical protein